MPPRILSLARSLAVVAVVAALAAPAHADRRAYGYTYEYQTMPEGGLDLEIWNSQHRPDLSSSANTFELKIETEYGITDHWDIALYQIFTQESGGPLSYDATSLETRYRFAERGELPIDTLVYFEVVKPLNEDGAELEWKLILGRDIGPVTLNLNLIAELLLGNGNSFFVPGWSVGASYEFVPAFKLGVETFGEYSEPSMEGADRHVRAWVGPALSWAPSPKIWFTGSAVFGVTSSSDDFIARIIIGISI